jgi:hypothetical protein
MTASPSFDNVPSEIGRGKKMDNSSDPVWIMFIADTETRDKLLSYSSGSQWQVDPNTAAALILIGAAVKLPSEMEMPPVPGVGGMSAPLGETA